MNDTGFIRFLTPTTLAAIVAELDRERFYLTAKEAIVLDHANAALVAIVGELEAEKLIADALGVI